ncbi:anti-sigma factor [Tellurirhabdus rosea]|uniref:anti-sigma factor n=1 Tax=Tellurirhabdus rosea TaxID=2674997 RepID=UPI00224F1E99|nr:anti-sigma factor [Tellurirhabdus rosea]
MNIQEYIESGILEAYVLGTVSPQEKREVECLSGIYPEIQQELDDLSVAMEQYALTLRRDPPAVIKENLLKQLDFQTPQEDKAVPVVAASEGMEAEAETPVRPLWGPNSRPTYRFSWVVAASTGLALLFFSLYLLSQLRDSQQTVSELRSSNETLQQDFRRVQVQQQRSEQTLALVRRPGTRLIRLDPVAQDQAKAVTLFWNPQSGEVQLEVDSLVRPPEFMQYQLWAIVDGKPVDAGVFEIDDWQHLVRTQKAFPRADAFAITVEKRGGSPTPTMSTMVVLGKTNA